MTDTKRLRELLEMDQGQPWEVVAKAHEEIFAALPALLDEVERLRAENSLEHEAAVFAKGYRKGFWNGSGNNVTPFQSEVDNAYDNWVRGGKRTHLTMEGK
jgi:hypothetical protein